jgi:hypothetical protein
MFLLAKHIRRSWLRARAGSQELGVPLAEYAASLRFQTSAPPTPKGRARTSFDIPEEDRADRRSRLIKNRWWSLSGSNRRPEACKATALPAELRPRFGLASSAGESVRFLGCPRHGARRPVGLRKKAGRRLRRTKIMVGLGRLERPTSPLSGVRSNHLSYRPQSEHKPRPMYPE